MNELLRLANELVGLDNGMSEPFKGWPCHGKYPCLYKNEVLTVIQGYQDLLRRIVKVLDKGIFHKATTVSNLEFVIEGEHLVNQLLMVLVEANASIPQEQSNE